MIVERLQQVFFWLLGVNRPETISGTQDWQWYTSGPSTTSILVALGVLAIIAAGVNLLPRSGMPWPTRIALVFLRLLGFALIVLLVVQLELRVVVERSLPPHVAIMTDVSDSMAIRDAGDQTRRDAAADFRDAVYDRLGEKVYVADYEFDWQARQKGKQGASESTTRIMDSLRDVLRSERELQAVLLLSDGNDTAGDEGAAVAPLFTARGVPVYPVTFGKADTPYAPGVRISGGSDYVRLGDELRLEATISAPGYAGSIVSASLYEGDATTPLLRPKEVRLREEPSRVEFVFKPDKPGRKIYRIEVDGLKDAPSRKLLVARHQVDVIDQKIRLLYIDVPRDERKILGHWLARDPVVDFAGLLLLPRQGWFAQGQMRHANVRGLPDDEGDLYEYDVIILGDIPRKVFAAGQDIEETKLRWLVDFVQRRGGGLITTGGRSVYGAGQYEGSPLAGILPFDVRRERKPQIEKHFNVVPTALGLSHPIMRLERDADGNRNAWLDLPEIEGCNRVGSVRPGASMLAYNATPDGDMPAIAYHQTGKGKVLATTIDTTWRWEMMRPRGSDVDNEPEGVDYFRRFWGNAVRHVAPDPRLEPELPQIARRQSQVAVGDTVNLQTRLVDRVFKPIRSADLTVRVRAPSGAEHRIFPADSRSEPGLYHYAVTVDEPGIWVVSATHREDTVLAVIDKAKKDMVKAEKDEDDAALSAAKHTLAAEEAKIARQELKVGENQKEMEDPRARPYAMEVFAGAVGGKAYRPDQIDDLVNQLQLAKHSFSQSYAIAIWNLPAIMIALIIIVCLDCYIRKRRGLV
jgi:uncharacterized membrane protein